MEQLPSSGKRNYNVKSRAGTWYGFACLALLTIGIGLVSFPAFSAALPETIDKIRPSVVAVGTYQPTGNPRQQFRGTGFVVADGRLVVTNFHVLPESLATENRETLAVFSGRGRNARFHRAKIVAEDPAHDLVILSIGASLPALSLDGRSKPREGSEIAFTGFPLGMALGLYPVTHRGIISAITPMAPPQLASRMLTAKMIRAMRDPFDVMQLDATAYPGSSGSPVFEQATGRVIGVINSVLVKETKEAAIEKPSGITYAIPARFIEALVEQAR